MRFAISGNGLLVIMIIAALINSAIVNKHIRELETNDGLEIAMEYALDRLEESFFLLEADDVQNEELQTYNINILMSVFASSLNEFIDTDGEVKITLSDADVSRGYFHIVVQEEYKYGAFDKNGMCVAERIVVFNNYNREFN